MTGANLIGNEYQRIAGLGWRSEAISTNAAKVGFGGGLIFGPTASLSRVISLRVNQPGLTWTSLRTGLRPLWRIPCLGEGTCAAGGDNFLPRADGFSRANLIEEKNGKRESLWVGAAPLTVDRGYTLALCH